MFPNYHTAPRLFVVDPLEVDTTISLMQEQSHYLAHVLRAHEGDVVRLFNGRDGEYKASVSVIKKKEVVLKIEEPLRQQRAEPNLHLFCAPIKRAHFDDMIMKATELGVAAIHPVLTGRTQVRDINVARLSAIAIEAAEQSERLNVPTVHDAVLFDKMIQGWGEGRLPLVCAEFGEALPVDEALHQTKVQSFQDVGVITGPEGGFLEEEMAVMRLLPHALPLRLGPRILRADTAAMAALACWQAVCGDWQNKLG